MNINNSKENSGYYKKYYDALKDEHAYKLDEFLPSYKDGSHLSMGIALQFLI